MKKSNAAGSENKPEKPLGHYGRLRKAFLQGCRPILYNELVLTEKLYDHCLEIEEAARHRIEVILPELIKRYDITEELKKENQMLWVGRMNMCRAQAEEVIKMELIYD